MNKQTIVLLAAGVVIGYLAGATLVNLNGGKNPFSWVAGKAMDKGAGN